jgi:hypothetical protein
LLRNSFSLCTISCFLSSFFISFFLILTSSAYWLYVYRIFVAFDHNQWQTHSIGVLLMVDRSVAEPSTRTTHNNHHRQQSMPPAGFQPAIPASEQPQFYALERWLPLSDFNSCRIRNIMAKKRSSVCVVMSVAVCLEPVYQNAKAKASPWIKYCHIFLENLI